MQHPRLDRRALEVARATVNLARDWHFGHLVPAGAADLSARFLYSYSPSEVHRFARAQSGTFGRFMSALEYLTAPGMALHYAVRKLAIEDLVRSSIDAGAQQVVVLGGGLDTLAVRLQREFPQRRFIEVDRAPNQEIKRRALIGQWAPGEKFDLVSADPVREPWQKKLLSSGFVAGAPTAFVAEGLFGSMEMSRRDAVFEFVRTHSGSGSSVVFTAMERGADGRIRYRAVGGLARLRWRLLGERFQWGPSRTELEEYLSRKGMRLAQLLTAADFRVRYLDGNPDVPLAEGEDVAVAVL